MQIIPFFHFTLYSDLDPKRLRRRLISRLAPEKFSIFQPRAVRQGRVKGDRFRVRYNSFLRNRSLIIAGRLVPEGKGTRLECTVDSSFTFLALVMIFWMASLFSLISSLLDEARDSPVILILFASIITAISGALAAFDYYSSINIIQKLIGSEGRQD